MRCLTLLLAVTAALTAHAESPTATGLPAATGKTALVIHGGAGFVPRETLSPADIRDFDAALNQALDAGNAVLLRGGSALHAVTASILVLEDNPRFNAGKGRYSIPSAP